MDIRMPELDGIEATRRIVGRRRLRPSAVLDAHHLRPRRVRLRRAARRRQRLPAQGRAGRAARRRRSASSPQGEALLAPSVTRRLIEEFAAPAPSRRRARRRGLDELTAASARCSRCWRAGSSNAEIAAELVVGEATVKTHVARVLMKLGVRDRVQAVVLAYESGLVRPARPRASSPARLVAPGADPLVELLGAQVVVRRRPVERVTPRSRQRSVQAR